MVALAPSFFSFFFSQINADCLTKRGQMSDPSEARAHHSNQRREDPPVPTAAWPDQTDQIGPSRTRSRTRSGRSTEIGAGQQPGSREAGQQLAAAGASRTAARGGRGK
jgi:hypothetical protein